MNKLLITLVLVFVSSSAMAAWTQMGKIEAMGVTTYIDLSSIQKSGNTMKVWSMKDFRAIQEAHDVKYLSFKIQEEFRCDAGLTRALLHQAFSGNMGKGVLVNSYDTIDGWRPIKPGSIGELELKAVCSAGH